MTDEKIQRSIILTSKKVLSIKRATTVAVLYMTLTMTLTINIWLDHLVTIAKSASAVFVAIVYW